MQIPVIKKLVETHSITVLKEAETAIEEGLEPQIEIEGVDEGEQLTHAFAAIFILDKMQSGMEFKKALREFTSKVRTSIS